MLTPLLIIASVTGALTACILACFQDRNALGWFVAGAIFPVVGLLLMLIEPRAGLRTVLAGACVALCGLSLWLALRLSRANEQLEVLHASHWQRISFCSDWSTDVSIFRYESETHESSYSNDDFGNKVDNVLHPSVLRVCGVSPLDVTQSSHRARVCWALKQNVECYRDVLKAVDSKARKTGLY